MNYTEIQITRILRERDELLNLYIDAGEEPMKVKRLIRWNILEFALWWYDFERIWVPFVERKIKSINDRFGN